MVMNKTSSINGQFGSNGINNNNNGPTNNGHLISNGKSVNSQPLYSNDAQRIEHYKVSNENEAETCKKNTHRHQNKQNQRSSAIARYHRYTQSKRENEGGGERAHHEMFALHKYI